MLKFATFQITSAVLEHSGMSRTASLTRQAHRAVFDYEPRPGYLYVRSRAISSRCNDNFDEFPAEEIKAAYRTFIGKPVFVNHHNDNHRRARGVIIDAALHEDRNADGSPDTWTEVLMEVDAVRFPILAKAILAGDVDRTSMGTDVEYSICSACGNKATSPAEYCQHIPKMKGKRLYQVNASTGRREGVLIRERCYGLKFFENSLLVEDPADPTAFFLGVDDRGMKMATTASALLPQDHGPHGPFNLHGQCKQCGYSEPTEADEECDDSYCQETGFADGWHTKGEHMDPPHLDPGHPDYQSAEKAVNDAFAGNEDAWLLHHQPDGPTKYSALDPAVDKGDQADRLDGVTLSQDDDGYYVRTHRARSDSYPTPESIPDSKVEFIRSTGSRRAPLDPTDFFRRTATWIGDHPEEPSLFWKAPKSGWEVHIHNHMPDRQLREEYGAKAHQQVHLLHEDQKGNRPMADGYTGPQPGSWAVQKHPYASSTGHEFQYTPNVWGTPVGHIPAHVVNQVRKAQAEVDKHAENHADLMGGLQEHKDISDDLRRVPHDMAAEEKAHKMFENMMRQNRPDDGPEPPYVTAALTFEAFITQGVEKPLTKRAAFLEDHDKARFPEFWAKPSGDAGFRPGHVTHRDLWNHVEDEQDEVKKADAHPGPFYMTRHPETRAHQIVDKDNHLLASMPGGHGDGPYGQDAIWESWHGANQVKGHIPAGMDKIEAVGKHPTPPFEHSTEDPEDTERKQRPVAREHKPEGYSPDDEWHGPYETVKHPETGKFHVVDNQGRYAGGLGSTHGAPDQLTAERRRDHTDRRMQSKEKAKGIAEGIWNSFADIVDPGGTDESRKSERHMNRMNDLMHRYEGGNHHPLTPGRFGYDDEEHEGDQNGQPFYEVKDPGGSGWKARDYGGSNLHVYHEATGEDAHDLIDAGDPATRDQGHRQTKAPDFGHEEMHAALQHWIHGDPNDQENDPGVGQDYAEHADRRIKPWQRRNGYTASKRWFPTEDDMQDFTRVAFGETKAPADVDTLREEKCPVCGEADAYDGDQCRNCGFVSPPQMFRDPDLDVAKGLDLRQDVLNDAGSLPGQEDPTAQDANGGLPQEIPGESTPGDGTVPVPVDPSMVAPDGSVAPTTDPAEIAQQQMNLLQSGQPLTPDMLGPNGEVPTLDASDVNMDAATQHFNQGGEPFTPGPNAPTPQQPLSPDQVNEDGEPIVGEDGQEAVVPDREGEPGTPADGTPDLQCPACGFASDAEQPTSVDMDDQALLTPGAGTMAGDVCPNCGQAQMLSVGQMEQMAGAPARA